MKLNKKLFTLTFMYALSSTATTMQAMEYLRRFTNYFGTQQQTAPVIEKKEIAKPEPKTDSFPKLIGKITQAQEKLATTDRKNIEALYKEFENYLQQAQPLITTDDDRDELALAQGMFVSAFDARREELAQQQVQQLPIKQPIQQKPEVVQQSGKQAHVVAITQKLQELKKKAFLDAESLDSAIKMIVDEIDRNLLNDEQQQNALYQELRAIHGDLITKTVKYPYIPQLQAFQEKAALAVQRIDKKNTKEEIKKIHENLLAEWKALLAEHEKALNWSREKTKEAPIWKEYNQEITLARKAGKAVIAKANEKAKALRQASQSVAPVIQPKIEPIKPKEKSSSQFPFFIPQQKTEQPKQSAEIKDPALAQLQAIEKEVLELEKNFDPQKDREKIQSLDNRVYGIIRSKHDLKYSDSFTNTVRAISRIKQKLPMTPLEFNLAIVRKLEEAAQYAQEKKTNFSQELQKIKEFIKENERNKLKPDLLIIEPLLKAADSIVLLEIALLNNDKESNTLRQRAKNNLTLVYDSSLFEFSDLAVYKDELKQVQKQLQYLLDSMMQ